MSEFYPLDIYLGVVLLIALLTLGVSALFPPVKAGKAKYLPYESGIRTETHLLQERFPLRHYLTALIFLVVDIEVVFLFPWAVVAKQIGFAAFLEISFFMVILMIGFAYVWRKGGLQWE